MPDVAIRAVDLRLIDALFDMGSGYVLDFSDRTYSQFFRDELRIDIDNPRYAIEGGSKAKRLRYLLRVSDSRTRARVLSALWEYRETCRRMSGAPESLPDAEGQFHALVERLGGKRATPKPQPAPSKDAIGLDAAACDRLKLQLVELSQLEPQPRGYAFEKFLHGLFEVNGLSPRASFRLRGEQIDGSFELGNETYLLEAKWQGQQTGSGDLRSFNGKVTDKAAWSRGLFVSHSGFPADGPLSFGRGKSVVCMDGLDLYDMLDRRLNFADVMSKKVRRAAEDGTPFVPVREL